LDIALFCFRKTIELNPVHVNAWYCKGKVHEVQGDCEAAIACYEKVIEINPTEAEAWTHKGNLLNYYGKIEEAQTYLAKA
jgi:tetratricopeptide (TPR) repeat protein